MVSATFRFSGPGSFIRTLVSTMWIKVADQPISVVSVSVSSLFVVLRMNAGGRSRQMKGDGKGSPMTAPHRINSFDRSTTYIE